MGKSRPDVALGDEPDCRGAKVNRARTLCEAPGSDSTSIERRPPMLSCLYKPRLIFVLLVVAHCGQANADWSYDFNDLKVPESWEVLPLPPFPSDTWSIEASAGYLTVSESRTFNEGGAPVLRALDMSEAFVDVRVAGTVNIDPSQGTNLGLTTDSLGSGAYTFGIEIAPSEERGTAWLGRAGGGIVSWGSERDFGIPTRLDIERSYYLELDVIGDEITGRVFDTQGGNLILSMSKIVPNPVTEPMFAGVATDTPFGFEDTPTAGTFDNILAIAIRPGDFDIDGSLSAADIDTLTLAIGGPVSGREDLNDDGIVDLNDHRVWVKDLSRTYYGDANLDGEFNSGDLMAVFQAGKYESDVSAGWAEGDWTGDRRFGSADLTAAFQDGGYELGPIAAVSSVPEPSCAMLLVFGVVGLGCVRRNCLR